MIFFGPESKSILVRISNINTTICSAFALVILSACGGGEKACTSKSEGVIEFDTKAVDENHPMASLAPSSATLKYKDENFVMEMSSFGFNTSIFGNLENKTMTQTVKFLDLKQACVEKEQDIKDENDEFKLKITETKETKQIAGLKCYKLKVSLVDSPQVTFDAYYTKDLGEGDFNKLTPYAQVKGMLMDYRAKRMGMEMHFKATEVKKIVVEDESFEIPKDINYVSKATIRKTCNPM
jgi:hypothetical protein